MLLSIIILGTKYDIKILDNMELLYCNGDNINDILSKAKGRYVCFIKETDKIAENYLDVIVNKIKSRDFDLCFINYKIMYQNDNIKTCVNPDNLKYKCYKGEYLWSFIYNRELLLKASSIDGDDFNGEIDKLFTSITSIGDIIYYHYHDNKRIVNNYFLTDIKSELYYKNVIYIGAYIDGKFNGYITWLLNVGKCFKDKNITLLYDNMPIVTYDRMAPYFNLVQYKRENNYLCDRLITTYSNYYYPKNIIPLEYCYVFIHGDLSYFYTDNSPFKDDIYNKYIAVSKTARDGAVKFLPTKNVDYILNPIKIEPKEIKKHLYLVSTLRGSSKVKKQDRFEVFAKVLDKKGIPYTWDVFTDKDEGSNNRGLIYRDRVLDPLPYVKDADYFVLFSDSEAFSYSVVEAVKLGVKIIVTPLKVYEELGIMDNPNTTVVPFEYFDDPSKLEEIVDKIYLDKEGVYDYNFKYSFDEYDEIFK